MCVSVREIKKGGKLTHPEFYPHFVRFRRGNVRTDSGCVLRVFFFFFFFCHSVLAARWGDGLGCRSGIFPLPVRHRLPPSLPSRPLPRRSHMIWEERDRARAAARARSLQYWSFLRGRARPDMNKIHGNYNKNGLTQVAGLSNNMTNK